jgi:hypothetical protein
VRPAQLIPCDEEGLGEVILGAVQLMVDVVVGGVVPEHVVEGVVRQPEPTVVVDSLDGGEGEEEDRSAGSHSGRQEGYGPAHGVQQKAFQGMVVQRSKRKRHYQTMMQRVHMLVHELVQVHPPVTKILPGIHHHHCHHELERHYPKLRLLHFLLLPGNLLAKKPREKPNYVKFLDPACVCTPCQRSSET